MKVIEAIFSPFKGSEILVKITFKESQPSILLDKNSTSGSGYMITVCVVLLSHPLLVYAVSSTVYVIGIFVLFSGKVMSGCTSEILLIITPERGVNPQPTITV